MDIEKLRILDAASVQHFHRSHIEKPARSGYKTGMPSRNRIRIEILQHEIVVIEKQERIADRWIIASPKNSAKDIDILAEIRRLVRNLHVSTKKLYGHTDDAKTAEILAVSPGGSDAVSNLGIVVKGFRPQDVNDIRHSPNQPFFTGLGTEAQ